MSAFLYSFHRGLYCLNLDDCLVESGRQLKKIASDCCGVGFKDSLGSEIHHFQCKLRWDVIMPVWRSSISTRRKLIDNQVFHLPADRN